MNDAHKSVSLADATFDQIALELRFRYAATLVWAAHRNSTAVSGTWSGGEVLALGLAADAKRCLVRAINKPQKDAYLRIPSR